MADCATAFSRFYAGRVSAVCGSSPRSRERGVRTPRHFKGGRRRSSVPAPGPAGSTPRVSTMATLNDFLSPVEWQQGGCRPQLSVITGRGNHSQGGVARIRPAVIDYLTNRKYT